jgi:transcriptional regulator with XRE-family HTH domain
MTQDDWAATLARDIAGQIRRHRLARELSAQQLADRCAALGMEIPRSVIANLEIGRRPTVSVAELLILAAALEVPPVALIAPLGQEPETRILPNRELITFDAILWMSGEARLPDDPASKEVNWINETDTDALIPMYHQHDRLLEEIEGIGSIFGNYLTLETGSGQALDRVEFQNDAISRLQDYRALMKQRGLLLPSLPPELEGIDAQKRAPRRSARVITAREESIQDELGKGSRED